MHDYTTLQRRDAILYFNKTLAVCKETSRVFLVKVVSFEDKGYYYKVGTSSLPAEEFHSKFFIYKFKLGWVQTRQVALYISSLPQRNAKKGYVQEDLFLYNPYDEFLQEARRLHLQKLLALSDPGGDKVIMRRLAIIDALRFSGNCVCNIKYLLGRGGVLGSIYSPKYLRFTTGIKRLREGIIGSVALSRDFAMSGYVGTGDNGKGSMFYRTKHIGHVLKNNVELFPPFRVLLEQLERQTGIKAEICK